MFKHNYDFGFQTPTQDINANNSNNDSDNDDNLVKYYMDCRDADDMAEDLDINATNNISNNHLNGLCNNFDNLNLDPDITKSLIPKPLLILSLDMDSHNLLELVSDLQKFRLKDEREEYDSLYEFALYASPELLKLILESIGNPDEIALAIHRLRIIIGVTEFDPSLDYNFYYIFSCCNDSATANPSDWENLISQDIGEINNEIFTGSIYMLSEHELNVVLLPANLKDYEKDLIRYNRIWGIKMQENIIGALNAVIQIEEMLTADGQDMQIDLLQKFMCDKIANVLPNLSEYKFKKIDSSLIATSDTNKLLTELFLHLYNKINEFLPAIIDEELDYQSQILLPHIQ